MADPGASDPPVPQAKVTVASATYVVDETEEFTFGRGAANTHCLNNDDLGISRTAGAVVFRSGRWWLINKSATNPLTVLENGLRETLVAGRWRSLAGPATVHVDGRGRSYRLDVDVPPPTECCTAAAAATEPGIATAGAPELSAREREVCELLFEPLFRADGRPHPIPAKYLAVARRLGLPESTVRRRVENLRGRLTRMGVVNLDGPTALADLGEYLISRGLIEPNRGDRRDRPDRPDGPASGERVDGC
jgi:hypothetical protein